ncbi:MAG: hypothetical protein ACRCU9_05235 [Iodobacter sp.]
MMRRCIFLMVLLAVFAAPANAFWMDSTTLELPHNKSTVSQTVNNPDNIPHVMTVKVERIKDPYSMSPFPGDFDKEVLFTPTRSVVAGRADSVVAFTYFGPKDDQERYYRIIWSDEAFSMNESSPSSKKSVTIGSRAILSTVLVVHPRQSDFQYKMEKNALHNTGNTTLRFVAYGTCKRKTDIPADGICRETRYLMPGASREFDHVDVDKTSAKIGIWHDGKFELVK